jgi:adenylosuccinate synthase
MKHSCLINGYDSLNLTKLDVLDEVEEIKVAVKYMIDDKELQYFPGELTMDLNEALFTVSPADLDVLAKVSVVYVTLPGWKTPISSITSSDNLPDNCKKYVGFIENFLGTPIEWIGVGPGRESMLKKMGMLITN